MLPPIVAGIGDQLNTFITGGGIGTYVQAILILLGVFLLLYALYLVVKNAVSSPPKVGRGVIEGFGAVVAAVLCLAAPARTGIFNLGGAIASAIFDTLSKL